MEGSFKVEGASEVVEQAKRARRDLDIGKNLVLRDIADLWRKGETEVFSSYGGAIGKPWRPLADSTVKSRARLNRRFGLGIGPTDPRLVLYGDMRASLTTKGGAQEQEISGSRLRISVDTSQINRHDRRRGLGMTLTSTGKRRKPPRGKGSRYPEDILKIHDEGAGRVPARPMIGTPAHVELEMEACVERFLANTLRILGGG